MEQILSQQLDGASSPLFDGFLLKSIQTDSDPDAPWKFAGIASDESFDEDGDEILRKAIDLSYAQSRGYVNWDHSQTPEDQLGFLTKAVIIDKKEALELKKSTFPNLSPTASVYVEGEFYKTVDRAASAYKIMQASRGEFGLGLSLEGSLARDSKSGRLVKAYVRGVAVTPKPCNAKTLVKLAKSLQFYNSLESEGNPMSLASEMAAEVANLVTLHLTGLNKSTGPAGLGYEQAVLYVLKNRPTWSYELAAKVVDFTINARS